MEIGSLQIIISQPEFICPSPNITSIPNKVKNLGIDVYIRKMSFEDETRDYDDTLPSQGPSKVSVKHQGRETWDRFS